MLDGFWVDGNHEDDEQYIPHEHETNWTLEETTEDVWEVLDVSDNIEHTNNFIDDQFENIVDFGDNVTDMFDDLWSSIAGAF